MRRHDVRRVIVGDDANRIGGDSLHEAVTGVARSFDERPVRNTEPLRRDSVVAHSLKDERVVPGAGPRVVQLQTLVHHERLLVFRREGDGAIEGVVRMQPPEHLRPVQYVLALRVGRAVVCNADTSRLNRGGIHLRSTAKRDVS